MLRVRSLFLFFFGLSQHAKEVGLVIFVFDPPQGTEITCDPASDKAADAERKANGRSSCLEGTFSPSLPTFSLHEAQMRECGVAAAACRA